MPSSKSTVIAKVNQALARAHQPALDECLRETGSLGDLQRVEYFMRLWIDKCLARAWTAIENADSILTEKNVMRLFEHLMEPFSFKHPFSCIPKVLTERIGQPPQNWQFIRVAVKQSFGDWETQNFSEPMPKKRRTNDGLGEMNEQDDVELKTTQEEEVAPAEKRVKPSLSSLKRATTNKLLNHEDSEQGVLTNGHPRCTSAEDCIGTRYDQLFRHLLDGQPADLYCQSCLESFLEQNPELESVPED